MNHEKKKGILIDTILYNPTTFIYNIDTKTKTATVYSLVDDKVQTVKLRKDKDTAYIIIDGEYYRFKYMFDITEKRNY